MKYTAEFRDIGDEIDLLTRSAFFDCRWYLSIYPDIDEAGLSPIRHYLQFGAAEGRNPSPLFDTRWYQENNPDASDSGVNPLVHFLRIGSARGRDPHPSFALRRRPAPISTKELEELFISHTQAKRPVATSNKNWRTNQEEWASYFISHGISALKSGEYSNALEQFKRTVQVCSDSWKGWSLYAHTFRLHNSRQLRVFEEHFSDAELLVIHISCKRLFCKAQASVRSFNDPSGRIQNVIVIGSGDSQFDFDPSTQVLAVPAGDSYEELPMKICSMSAFVGISNINCPVLKVDDDVHCRDVLKLRHDLDHVIVKSDYGGRVVVPPMRLHDCRIWHFDKCTDDAVNHRPDGLFSLFPYATGPYYWLSRNALNILWKGAIMHDRYFECEIGSEDRAVGLVLSYYGISPRHAMLTQSSLQSV
jgi:hypothetical protein